MTNFTTSISLSAGKGKFETYRYTLEDKNKIKSQKSKDLLKTIMEVKNKDTNQALEHRIKQREREEAKKERELILNGKITPTKAQVKSDKILQIYERVRMINQKAKLQADSKPKLRTQKKWQRTAVKLAASASSFKTLPMFPVLTVQGESQELNRNLNIVEHNSDRQLLTRENPIHKSFAEAKTVDELYQLADFWLSLPNAASPM